MVTGVSLLVVGVVPFHRLAGESMADLAVIHPVSVLVAILENGRCRHITTSRRAVRDFAVGVDCLQPRQSI